MRMRAANAELLPAGLTFESRHERISFRPRPRRNVRQVQQRWQQVLGLAKPRNRSSRRETLRMPNQQRNVANFFINRGWTVGSALHEFSDHVVLAKIMAVVGAEDYGCVIEHFCGAKLFEQ